MPTLTTLSSTTVEAKHHHTSISASSATLIPSDASSLPQSQDAIRRSLSYIDRDSAIALGTIFIFILLAAGYCVHLRIRERQRADLESEAERTRRASTRTWRSYGSRSRAQEALFRERIWSRAISRGSLPRGSFSTLRGSVSGLFKKDSRSGSWPTSVSSSATTRVGSVDDIPLPDACAWRHHHCRAESVSRSSSPHSQYRSRAPSTSHHRRQSSVHDIPDPIIEDLQSHRLSTQRRQERRSSTGAPRRASTVHIGRRFSALEPIAEPGPGIALPARAMSSGERSVSSNHRVVRGSRSGAYNWSRPSVGAVQNVSGEAISVEVQRHDEFKRVVWGDKQGSRESSNEGEGDVGRQEEVEGEDVERRDWATVPHDL